jgi:threonine synthase
MTQPGKQFQRYTGKQNIHWIHMAPIGYKALTDYINDHPSEKGIFLETAHPVKFPEVVETSTGAKIEVPASVEPLFTRHKTSIVMPQVLTI